MTLVSLYRLRPLFIVVMYLTCLLDNYNGDSWPFSLLLFSLFSLRVPGVSASKRADTHPAPLLNADPLSPLILSLGVIKLGPYGLTHTVIRHFKVHQ